eukprot:5471644-Prymnesium_polylepis.2
MRGLPLHLLREFTWLVRVFHILGVHQQVPRCPRQQRREAGRVFDPQVEVPRVHFDKVVGEPRLEIRRRFHHGDDSQADPLCTPLAGLPALFVCAGCRYDEDSVAALREPSFDGGDRKREDAQQGDGRGEHEQSQHFLFQKGRKKKPACIRCEVGGGVPRKYAEYGNGTARRPTRRISYTDGRCCRQRRYRVTTRAL